MGSAFLCVNANQLALPILDPTWVPMDIVWVRCGNPSIIPRGNEPLQGPDRSSPLSVDTGALATIQ